MAPRNTSPGTVVIVLAGPNAGMRAVVVKTLPKSSLVIYGPKCSIMRIPRKHCVATSMKLDVSGVKSSDSFEDELFKKEEVESLKSKTSELESQISSIIKKDALVEEYLNSCFSLNKCLGVPPHELKF